MKNLLFIKKRPTDYKANKRFNKIMMTANASVNMTQIIQFYKKNICLNLTTHLLYRNRWRTCREAQYKNKYRKFNLITTKHTLKKWSFSFNKQYVWLMCWLLVLLTQHVNSLQTITKTHEQQVVDKKRPTTTNSLYSQLLTTNGETSIVDNKGINRTNNDDDDIFRPFVPTKQLELLAHKVFAPSGQYHVFQPTNTDLRNVVTLQQHKRKTKTTTTEQNYSIDNVKEREAKNSSYSKQQSHKVKRKYYDLNHNHKQKHKQHPQPEHEHEISNQYDVTTDLKSLEDLLVEYVANVFVKNQNEIMPGLIVELPNESTGSTRTIRQTSVTDANIKLDLPRSLATGRLLFLTGLKKVLWPVFMGLQVLKSVLIAMFIPALIGSFTKLLGKGIATGSAPLFIRPLDPPQELDFRDNTINFDDDHKFLVMDDGIRANGPYMYNQPDASQMNNEYVFDPSANNNQASFIRLGMNERQHQLMQDSYMSALQSIGSASFKNSGSLSSGSSGLVAPMAKRPPPAANVNTFQQFQKVPDSSLLLSNYDPFYSPLLSRLDSVFAQLKLNSEKEICREKLICLMYANPAKYAPYSNLVSAQLSRELNELRKPTSDNPDILRFFKYMRAAKDGQDGVECEKTFDNCTEFKDFENPAMVSTYHDINKLVQARKFK